MKNKIHNGKFKCPWCSHIVECDIKTSTNSNNPKTQRPGKKGRVSTPIVCICGNHISQNHQIKDKGV